jgi:hypothetical protein
MNERRSNPRIPLEHMHYVYTVSAGREILSVLLDISVCGARIGFPPGEALPPAGSEVHLKDASVLASLLDNHKALVMWAGGVQFGVRFTQKIDAQPEDIAKLLQSEIFY